MTTEPKGLTDAECDQIQMDVFGHINVNEREYQHANKLIRAAYAAGAASVPKVAHPCPDCGEDDWIPGDYQCAKCGNWVGELPDAATEGEK